MLIFIGFGNPAGNKTDVTYNHGDVLFSNVIMAAICGCNQLKVERLILEGYSVFMSGKGGCGKSFLMKQVILGLE